MQDIPGGEGISVTEVQASSPASEAGLRKGDVITTFNGRVVRGAAELRARLSVVPVGEKVDLRVRRGAETLAIAAKIGPPLSPARPAR
jgi:S1-C subfamily serine protease